MKIDRSVGLMILGIVFGAAGAAHAQALLTGTIASAAGEKMGGVTVSARAQGSPITTSVSPAIGAFSLRR